MAHTSKVFMSNAQDRLESLIAKRLKSDADKARIDRRIWDVFGETWCVMFTDLSGFSRQVEQFGIIHFLQVVVESERIFTPVVEEHDGFILKKEGDSLMVIFRDSVKALRCAVEMQRVAHAYNLTRPKEEWVILCVGVGYGSALRIGDHDLFGPQVNAASKLGEDFAGPGEILVTGELRSACANEEGFRFEHIDRAPSGAASAYRFLYQL